MLSNNAKYFSPQPLNIKLKSSKQWREAPVGGKKSSKCAGSGSASEWRKREGWENSTGRDKNIIFLELFFNYFHL